MHSLGFTAFLVMDIQCFWAGEPEAGVPMTGNN